MEELLLELVQSQPKLVGVFVVVGVMRAVFKPIMSVVEAYVKSTPNEEDDKKLLALKEHKAYKALVWLVDYLLSVKLPK
jgi:hypothetical protein